MSGILYLSEDDIARLPVSVSDIHETVKAVFRAKSVGGTLMKPKLSISPQPGHVAEALVGVLLDDGIAGCKWLGVSRSNAALGLPTLHATIMLSGIEDGRLRTVMDGRWVTGVRTAACTAIAAEHMAPAEGRTIGFVGCGLQARTHLQALRHIRTGLTRARLFSRTVDTAQRFANYCREQGVEAVVCAEPRQVVEESDIIVSTVPPAGGLQPFLDAAWVKPGAFVGAVDLGRSWKADSWKNAFAFVATDDREQSETRGRTGAMLVPDRFDAELGELAERFPAHGAGPTDRTAMLFSGIALADVAVGALVEAIARREGIGKILAR
ncbi:ornithine cyclodeaminase family protein [Shinella sp. S4-D37]|uniref:ornithine cyclodeaminase family protein n=1 Tax=Shinella sp. S4-D37 TaxID=3161999 RepID=UPI0034659314